ncbi:hypothetical protein EUA93_06480 [Nocardioides oleivorans]|uniref:PASTA domain-containing protein n=1 Tax=Nocardioides oleivorans TaxID=273676 RepID=A0A4Q2RY76_9ACTN|nr:hypothetical protein [Nocardioides oleivorans]RYB94028.1 hypothetical protein EUA93_06480 [Nocardioides oleivorans]
MTGTRAVRTWLVLAACCLALAGCTDDTDPPPSEETAVDATDPSSQATTGSASPDVRASVDDLAARLGVDAGEVEVVAVEQVTWRDGSRGCATAGDMYTQALVDGARITLRVDGTDHEYHSGGAQPPALCEDPTE